LTRKFVLTGGAAEAAEAPLDDTLFCKGKIATKV